MVTYLEEHPPASSQYRRPRREPFRGVGVLHTAESALDVVGPDGGAEGVAAFIARRADPGSYHDLVDSDSWIRVVPYGWEAFHVGTHLLNRSTTGLSFACRTSDWRTMDPIRKARYVQNGAAAAVAQSRAQGGIAIRRISLAQVLAGESGWISHGDCDPSRRTDPGAEFPWASFLAAVRDLSTPTPPTQEDDMPLSTEDLGRIGALVKDQAALSGKRGRALDVFHRESDGAVFAAGPGMFRHLSIAEWADLVWSGYDHGASHSDAAIERLREVYEAGGAQVA